jgi:hypothetical protein
VILTFRPIKVWPDGWRTPRSRPFSPFKATYAATLDLLDRELHQLGAKDPMLQVDASESDVRLDGQLRANARVNHPGVILTIDTRRHGTLVYPCDAFTTGYGQQGWQANLRAIALGLEALRKVERYGIAERGQQYAGYREIGSGIALGEAKMTVEGAAAFIAEQATDLPNVPVYDVDEILESSSATAAAYRLAAKRLHPDQGGDPALFRKLTEARDLLDESTP